MGTNLDAVFFSIVVLLIPEFVELEQFDLL